MTAIVLLTLLVFLVGVILLACLIGWIEESAWTGKKKTWRNWLFPVYQKLEETQEALTDKKRSYTTLYNEMYGVIGLEATVKDLKTVLEWNRDKMAVRNIEYGKMQTSLETAKREVLKHMMLVHNQDDHIAELKMALRNSEDRNIDLIEALKRKQRKSRARKTK
jgi:hypothetical protein